MAHRPPTPILAILATTLATTTAGCGGAHKTATRTPTSTRLSVATYEAQIVPHIINWSAFHKPRSATHARRSNQGLRHRGA
jgi:hypothetical protein